MVEAFAAARAEADAEARVAAVATAAAEAAAAIAAAAARADDEAHAEREALRRRCLDLEAQLKSVVTDGAATLREQLLELAERLEGLEGENAELRAAVLASTSTYERAAALGHKIAELQSQVELLTLDKEELQVQLELAQMSPTPGSRVLTASAADLEDAELERRALQDRIQVRG
ncbi:hypothetical protein GPECTOR_11g245 [Gonium pectorale]|uniref:Uncharacterized protein n=1 Tax=Gonium pectorale TaxID=33097 RepID=A0A150GPP4_GONPE|nr:hypothetical protein GPECTOR_11g245 [Gonium pectorale]|eukprot:KXZ51803.1 hypothetical protein GPECTOR_11g245 [Gonium pectorale]